MKRRVRTALVLFSLVACVAIAVLWGRSVETQDVLHRRWVRTTADGFTVREMNLYSARGEITGIWTYRDHSGHSRGWEDSPLSWRRTDVEFLYAPAGYGPASWNIIPNHLGHDRSDSPDPSIRQRAVFTYWRVPYWPLAVATALLSAWASVRAWRSRRRVSPELCVVCGYDLRATPERCPECGTVPRASAATERVTKTWSVVGRRDSA